MRISAQLWFIGIWLVGGLGIVSAQPTNAAPENPLLREARQLSESLVAAANRGDVAAALALFDTNCLVTWCNAELSRGHESVRAFHERFLGGPVKRVESFNCEVRLDEAVPLYAEGAMAVCSGGFNESFKLAGGRKIDLQGRWSATLVRRERGWLIVNLQLSTDPFNNSLLNMAKQAGWVVGVVSLLLGAAAGWFIGRRRGAAAVAG